MQLHFGDELEFSLRKPPARYEIDSLDLAQTFGPTLHTGMKRVPAAFGTFGPLTVLAF